MIKSFSTHTYNQDDNQGGGLPTIENQENVPPGGGVAAGGRWTGRLRRRSRDRRSSNFVFLIYLPGWYSPSKSLFNRLIEVYHVKDKENKAFENLYPMLLPLMHLITPEFKQQLQKYFDRAYLRNWSQS